MLLLPSSSVSIQAVLLKIILMTMGRTGLVNGYCHLREGNGHSIISLSIQYANGIDGANWLLDPIISQFI